MRGQDVIFSRETDEWKTPPKLVRLLNKHFKISVDPCCSVHNVRAKKHYTQKDNGLKQPWETWTYVNPPYSAVYKWMAKAYREHTERKVKVMLLVFAKTETRFFQEFAFKATYLLFIRSRLKFQGRKRKADAAPFGSCLVIFGRINRYQHKELSKLGHLIKTVKKV